MQWGLINYMVSQFVLGLVLGGVFNFVFFRNRKWRPFRFGGVSPLSFGQKGRWITWFGFVFLFEHIFNLWFGDKRLAMWGFEATALTIGLFVADRLAMMLEPESNWISRAPKPLDLTETKPVTGKVEVGPSWAAEQLNQAKETAGVVAEDLKTAAAEKLHTTKGIFSAWRERRELQRKAKEGEAQKRLDRFRDLTKGN